MQETINQIKNEIIKLEKDLQDHENLVLSENNEEMKNLYLQEIDSIKSSIESLNSTLSSLENGYESEAGSEDNQAKINPNVAILEIRSGTGGDEAGLFAFDLYRMYMRYFEKVKWKTEENFFSENEVGGIKTASITVKGKNAYALLKNESGVHRVQRIPTTESGGRIHTSTATVAILPEVSKIEIEIRPEEIKLDFFRAGGHGGQNVNKVSTAVRITHLPTGVVVECQEERSQGKNRDKAMGILKSRLFTMMQEQQVKNIADVRSEQVGTGDRSEKIRTYNYPQDRITDHRLLTSWFNMIARMNGDIDEILFACSQINANSEAIPQE